MLSQLERYIKVAIVDKSPQTATAALVAGFKLLPAAPDLVRRWGSEVSEVAASTGRTPLVQYHAMGLLYNMRRGDKLAVAKMVAQFSTCATSSSLSRDCLWCSRRSVARGRCGLRCYWCARPPTCCARAWPATRPSR
jgi:coatomer protein complex subunit gamma